MGQPPHWGKVFKMKCTKVDVGEVYFIGEDHRPMKIELAEEDAAYFKVGQEYTVDFRFASGKQDKGK